LRGPVTYPTSLPLRKGWRGSPATGGNTVAVSIGVPMLFACILIYILAIELPSLRISPLLLIRIATIALLYAAAVILIVVYIQSIGSGIGIFSGLFHVTLISQSIETLFYFLGAIILTPCFLAIALPSLFKSSHTRLVTLEILAILLLCAASVDVIAVYIQSIGFGIGAILDIFSFSAFNNFFEVNLSVENILFHSLLLPVKSKRLSNEEKFKFILTEKEESILPGLLLGDLNVNKQAVNARLRFKQSFIHKEYLDHLYDLFSSYTNSSPVITTAAPDLRTGNIYKSVIFNTYSLPCFNKWFDLFYDKGKKIVPLNIGEFLTPLSLAYWICDDGYFLKNGVHLCTDSFTSEEVKILVKTLDEKFGFKCTINSRNDGFRISSKSTSDLQKVLASIMPRMMLYKIGL
jgi:hypothetical protein